ncbi:MAG: AlpA family transcriptional regulator [Klebsiella grimontii]|uniref:Predicted transcriptional regulator n=1 Tax=Raoultella terrigena TaxID=577 RepID=A0A3P8KAV5_RAOTE|nr:MULTISPECIES: AlpA family transcriptional regulator [Enterobacterales]EKN4862953.1 AlpA family transcriptional regulator [Yersinia enterocolitica]VDR25845.1 Predicted transcriptional regulator [Raoultella terrigena]MBS0928846.1 AlpA family transcriptional regulator [Klebsiella michiganensis]MDU2706834.1 AlpA family transcriptional regulator [Klebsiella grimontii]CAI1687487.1 Predicted transcriptional regulator [Serratia grimesii]
MKNDNTNQQRKAIYEQNEVTPRRLIRLPEVLKRVGLSRARMYGLINAGRFPKQVRIGLRSVAFIESEIEAWMDSVIAARNESH